MQISQITKEEFLNTFQQYDFVSSRLKDAGIPFAIFAGSEVWLLTNSRIPTDLDILVKNNDLPKIAKLFNQELRIKRKEGVFANYILIDNVEIVANIIITKDQAPIHISLDAKMIDRIIHLNLAKDYTLPLLAVEDTIIIKALLRRGISEDKFDLQDIKALASKIEINEEYLKIRIQEIHAEKYLNTKLSDSTKL